LRYAHGQTDKHRNKQTVTVITILRSPIVDKYCWLFLEYIALVKFVVDYY